MHFAEARKPCKNLYGEVRSFCRRKALTICILEGIWKVCTTSRVVSTGHHCILPGAFPTLSLTSRTAEPALLESALMANCTLGHLAHRPGNITSTERYQVLSVILILLGLLKKEETSLHDPSDLSQRHPKGIIRKSVYYLFVRAYNRKVGKSGFLN